jgi:Mrp family chromosome partitioning ATPase
MIEMKQEWAQDALKEALREIHVMAGFDGRPTGTEASPLVIGVTSPHFSDGKTTMAIGLAGSIAQDYDAEVTLVDADFHTHSIASDFHLDGADGMSEVLDGVSTIEAVTQRVARARLNVIPAGNLPADPARLARSESLLRAIDGLRASSRFVVIDLPAALHSMNTPVLARRCDVVVVVIRHGRTSKADLDRTLHLLRDANVAGVVLNRQRSSVPKWVERALSLRS